MNRALTKLLDRATRKQAGFVTGLSDLVLILVERGNRAEQRGVLRTQALGRGDNRLDQPGDVRAANRNFATRFGNAVYRAALGRVNGLVKHAIPAFCFLRGERYHALVSDLLSS